MYTGPNIERDGLVFGYDTGEFSENNSNHETFKPFNSNNRFFKGAASRNYIAGQNAVSQETYTSYSATSSGTWNAKHPNAITAVNAQGNSITGYVNGGVGDYTNTYHAHWQYDSILKKPVVVMEDLIGGQWKAKSFGTGLGSWNSLGLTHGSKYTISWLQWVDNLSKNAKAGLYTKNSSGGNGFHDGQANSASAYNTKLMTWQRVYQTYTTSSVRDLNQTLASIYMYGHYNVRATVKIADVQIDLHDHATSYQESNTSITERSSTEGLLDLVGNTTIDTSNVSFNNHGFPKFDGTDDTIALGNSSQFNITDSMSVFSWIKPDNISSWNGIFGGSVSGFVHFQLYNGGINVYLYGPNAAYASIDGVIVGTNAWTNIGFTFGDNTLKVYVNGEQLPTTVTGNGANISGNSDVRVGWAYATSRLFQGSIPITKVYNKVLTPEEVTQTYNSYKNRFDI